MSAGGYTFDELKLSAAEMLILEGDVIIQVEGPISIEGTITGDCVGVEIRGSGNLTLNGIITNKCSEETDKAPGVRLIIEGDITLGSLISDEPVIISDGSIFISDPGGASFDLTPIVIDEDSATFQPRLYGKLAVPSPQGWGFTRLNQPVIAGRGATISSIRAQGYMEISVSLTASDGIDTRARSPIETCDNSLVWGGAGGSIHLAVRNGILRFKNNITIKAGDGGAGGSCTAEGCPATSLGGHGGEGGRIHLGGENIIFGTGVTLIPGNGGDGGETQAMGDAGRRNCQIGCDASATGGKGGEGGGIGFVISLPGTILGMPIIEGANGGNGGLASAHGGEGGTCEICPAGEGSAGGNAIAIGGQGGNGGSVLEDWGFQVGTHLIGGGGNAIAIGGNGGSGETCCMPPDMAGVGGDGGEATANGGLPGTYGAGEGVRGASMGSFTGDGGDGGEGNPPGIRGLEGSGIANPDAVAVGNPGNDGDLCPIRVWSTYVSLLDGTWVHAPGSSEIRFVLFIAALDNKPVPKASVDITMSSQKGQTQTMKVNTGPDGIAIGSFQIYDHDIYTLTVKSIQGDNLRYDPSLNETTSIALEVGSNEGPHLEISRQMVEAFMEAIGQSIRKQDTIFLFNHLHPEVLLLYGISTCHSYIGGLDDDGYNIQVIDVRGPEIWDFERDGLSKEIPAIYTVSAYLTSQGEKEAKEFHVALEPAGLLRWFTDCGEPLQ